MTQPSPIIPNSNQITRLGAHAYARLAGGNPNSGFIVGREGVIIVDAAPTPVMAKRQLDDIRQVTDAPIRYVLLTHYHAVRVLGASYYRDLGAEVVMTEGTRALIEERGEADKVSEMTRFPSLFVEPNSVKGLVYPSVTFNSAMCISLGDVDVEFIHLGRGHTSGDAIAWLPEERVCFSGDLVEMEVGVYAGDAYHEEWLQTLQQVRQLKPQYLVPGRGIALTSPEQVNRALDYTERWITQVLQGVRAGLKKGWEFKQTYEQVRLSMDPDFKHVWGYEHAVAYAIARAFDECRGLPPKIWTEQEDQQMRNSLPGIL